MVALWLIHIEELLPFFHGKAGSKEDEDTVYGLMRFFIVHFPPVINKLLPAGTPAELGGAMRCPFAAQLAVTKLAMTDAWRLVWRGASADRAVPRALAT